MDVKIVKAAVSTILHAKRGLLLWVQVDFYAIIIANRCSAGTEEQDGTRSKMLEAHLLRLKKTTTAKNKEEDSCNQRKQVAGFASYPEEMLTRQTTMSSMETLVRGYIHFCRKERKMKNEGKHCILELLQL